MVRTDPGKVRRRPIPAQKLDLNAAFAHKPASMKQTAAPALAFALLILGTTLGIAGTDLVLPAVPGLPDVLGGSAAMASSSDAEICRTDGQAVDPNAAA